MLTKWIGHQSITDYAQAVDNATKPIDGRAMAEGTPEEWATESHELAVSVAYKGVPADAETHLTQAYVDAAKPVVEKQLERGGVRLAKVLNTALGSATTRPTRKSSR